MSAAERMAVRTPDGQVKVVPRRVGLGMIARNRAKPAPMPTYVHPLAGTDAAELAPERDPIVYAPQEPVQDAEAPTVPVDPEPAPTAPQRVQTPTQIVDAAAAGELPDVVHVEDQYPAGAGDVFREELPPEPRGNAGREEWAVYAQSLGVEVTEDMGRNKIRDAAKDAALSLDRLPQPALTGGRLDTPEDEPATETVADDPDTRTR
jgi:hypothetical protein